MQFEEASGIFRMPAGAFPASRDIFGRLEYAGGISPEREYFKELAGG